MQDDVTAPVVEREEAVTVMAGVVAEEERREVAISERGIAVEGVREREEEEEEEEGEMGRRLCGTLRSFSRVLSMEGWREGLQLCLRRERNSTAPISTRLAAATSLCERNKCTV